MEVDTRVYPCTHRPRATCLKLQYFRVSGTGILQLNLSLFHRPCSNVGGVADDLKTPGLISSREF